MWAGNNFTTNTEFLYDAKGRMTQSRQSTSGATGTSLVEGTLQYSYSGADQLEGHDVSERTMVRLCGNAAGQLTTVSGVAGGDVCGEDVRDGWAV